MDPIQIRRLTAARGRWVLGGLLLALLPSLAGCPVARPDPRRPVALPGPRLPRRPDWPAVSPTTSDRFAESLQVYYALAPSPRRTALARQLERHILVQLPEALRQGQGRRGTKLFRQLLSLHRWAAATESPGLDATARAAIVQAARLVLATFAKRGGAREALLAHGVLAAVASTGRDRSEAKFREIVRWLTDLEDPLMGRIPRFVDPIAAVNEVYLSWPSPLARRTLQVLLARQFVALSPLWRLTDVPDARPFRQAMAALKEYGWQRVRLLLLAGDLALLKGFHLKLKSGRYPDPHLETLLGQALDPRLGVAPLITLAEALAPKWPDAARALCRQVTQRAPRQAAGWYCLGRLALAGKRTLVALKHFEAAIRADPGYRQAWERYVSTYLDRLLSLLAQERLDQVRLEVRFLERVHKVVAAYWVDRPLKSTLADVYFMLGRGLFNEGLIDEAVTTLRKALKIKPTPQVFTQLAEIAYWRGRYRVALERFDSVLKHLKKGTGWWVYWEFRTAPMKALVREGLARSLLTKAARTPTKRAADALRREAKTEQARATLLRRRALNRGQFLLQALRSQGLTAEVLVHVGRLLYRAGRRRLALRSFDAALDRAPERSSTYVDVISFLVMRGHFDEALDAYHRALARSEISEYLKAYCTFWIVDLGRRAGVDADRLGLAEVFLKHLKGRQWYHQLARFHRGEVGYAELLKRAKTKGQRAEVDFYQSMRLLQKGRQGAARKLWQQIVDSEMMAFFEYKMVRRYLAHGAPTRPPP